MGDAHRHNVDGYAMINGLGSELWQAAHDLNGFLHLCK